MAVVNLVVPVLAILSAPQLFSHAGSPARPTFRRLTERTTPTVSLSQTDLRSGATTLGLPDGSGGQYMLWSEVRDGSYDLFLLRITNNGAPASGWPVDGLVVCNAPGDQREGALFSDGANGVVVGWLDGRDDWLIGDAYGQRVSPAGVPQWTPNGVKVVSGSAGIEDIAAASDGQGGLVVAWSTSPTGLLEDFDILATRITGAGTIPAGWAGGIVVCDEVDAQERPTITSDGNGGALIAWNDHRTSRSHVYAQYFDETGAAQWTTNGIQIDDSAFEAYSPAVVQLSGGNPLVAWFDSEAGAVHAQLLDWLGVDQWPTDAILHPGGGGSLGDAMVAVSDEFGGAIAAWFSFDGSYYGYQAQRVSAGGATPWGANGVSVVHDQDTFQGGDLDFIADGTGGAFFAWTDYNSSVDVEIHAQRVTATGEVWAANGVPVCTAGGLRNRAFVAPDGAGGVLVCWNDWRSGDEEIYTQRFNSTGEPQFVLDGLASYTNPGVQRSPRIFWMSDGGTLVVWEEKRNGQYDIRARKFNVDGSPAASATILSSAPGTQMLLETTFSGVGGLVSWWDENTSRAYVQRLDVNANPMWTANGVEVCPTGAMVAPPRMVSDQAGGALFCWPDFRGPNLDIYAQRINGAGTRPWGNDGVPVCSAANNQRAPVMVSDAANGAIMAWLDERSAPNEIYAQRIDTNGTAYWTPNGLLVASYSLPSGYVLPTAIVPGGASTAILLIHEFGYDPAGRDFTSAFHAQKVDAAGGTPWSATGTMFLDHLGYATFEHMVDDGSGGAYVAWSDDRNGLLDIYAQHVDTDGIAWNVGGTVVCDVAGWQYLGGLSRLSTGDAVLTWADDRNGQPDIYAHRIDATGADVWSADGIVVSDAVRGQFSATLSRFRMTTPEEIYVAWTDNRAGDERLVYAERLDLSGNAQWTPDGVTSTQIALASAEADRDRVTLVWYGSESVMATVYRRTEGSAWSAIASLVSDGTGRIVFEDREVEPGTRYGYRLGVREGTSEVLLGETWIDVPNNLQLALHGLSPNPAVGELVVAFTLPRGDAAKLELLDPAGRRVQSHELNGLAPGRHTLRLEGSAPAPGVYFLKLTQNHRSVTARAAVIK